MHLLISAEFVNHDCSSHARYTSIDGPGAYGAGDTLVPIPNTKVKTCCGDDTRKGKVARCRIITKLCESGVLCVLDIISYDRPLSWGRLLVVYGSSLPNLS